MAEPRGYSSGLTFLCLFIRSFEEFEEEGKGHTDLCFLQEV